MARVARARARSPSRSPKSAKSKASPKRSPSKSPKKTKAVATSSSGNPKKALVAVLGVHKALKSMPVDGSKTASALKKMALKTHVLGEAVCNKLTSLAKAVEGKKKDAAAKKDKLVDSLSKAAAKLDAKVKKAEEAVKKAAEKKAAEKAKKMAAAKKAAEKKAAKIIKEAAKAAKAEAKAAKKAAKKAKSPKSATKAASPKKTKAPRKAKKAAKSAKSGSPKRSPSMGGGQSLLDRLMAGGNPAQIYQEQPTHHYGGLANVADLVL